MIISHLWLKDFRNYDEFEIDFDEGLTALIGRNGIGKSNIIESLVYLSTLKSFRGSPTESLIKRGKDTAFIRAEGIRDDRSVLIEIEISKGKSRVQVNRQKLKKNRELLGALQVSVFSPDDLALIKTGPAVRRDFIDSIIIALDPRLDALFQKRDRVLKQRNSLLKQARGNLDATGISTLEVWDSRFAEIGEQVVDKRLQTVQKLVPLVNESYKQLSNSACDIRVEYFKSWQNLSLLEALEAQRTNDLRRAITSVGPHRDDIIVRLDNLSSRNEASQGEQRTIALAFRLASHKLITAALGEAPLLVLDDVLSELDPSRAVSLLTNLPKGQTFITSASTLPESVKPGLLCEFVDEGIVKVL